jgi:ABC-type multidrug transport system fused ATPase/permease subunit
MVGYMTLRSTLLSNVRSSALTKSLRLLPRKARQKLLLVSIAQILLGALDLLGVGLIGVLGALTVRGISSQQSGDMVNMVLEIIGVQNLEFQKQAAILGLMAAGLLITRTVISIYLTRRTIYFMSRCSAQVTSEIFAKILSKPLLFIQTRTTQEILFAVTTGVGSITLGVLATTVAIVADSSLLVLITLMLFVVDPAVATLTLLIFGSLGFGLFRFTHVKAKNLGIAQSTKSISSNQKILEILNSYRESVVRNRRSYYVSQVNNQRLDISNTFAEATFMPYISKYVIETAVVIGTLTICAVQFVLLDATQAITSLTILLAAGTRIGPAVLRVQQGALTIKSNLGAANPTLDLFDDLSDAETVPDPDYSPPDNYSGFDGSIIAKDLTFRYPGKDYPAITDVSFSVNKGESIAFVGPSGAGKSTLVDTMLGILAPEKGQVLISGLDPMQAIRKWPGAISYVPQNVLIIDGTIRENISLGYPIETAKDEKIWTALTTAQLASFVHELPNGIDTQVGEAGSQLSGGQRQRLGIARALFTNPKLLIFDEATSALDGQIESDITDAIQRFQGEVTVVIIAHRLSTIRNANKVCYLDSGKLVASGTFSEVRQAVPQFDSQAKKTGL